MKESFRANVLLHVIVLIFGFTGVLGKLISANSDVLVLYRMFIAALGIWAYGYFTKKIEPISTKQILKLIGIGGIIALHWITFFESIKVSNISVALICISSASLFTALLEPLFYRRRVNLVEIFFGLIVVAGLLLIFNFEPQYQLGITLSLISAFLAALFTVLNGMLVKETGPTTISAYEIGGGALILLIYLGSKNGIDLPAFMVSLPDLGYLLILGLICTSYAFVASVQIMKQLTPFTVALTINLEPIYAIIMAFAFFGEHNNVGWSFYLGGAMILGTVILNGVVKNPNFIRNRRLWFKKVLTKK